MRLHNKVNKQELKDRLTQSNQERTTLSFYRYIAIEDPDQFRDELYMRLQDLEVYGRIYIASEGFNGQVSTPTEKLNELKNVFDSDQLTKDLRLNIAIDDDGKSFYLLKIKVKDKIVADGLPANSVDLSHGAPHIDAETFNEMTANEQTIVIDMRNHYESEVGHFENAICPDVVTFRESLPVVDEVLQEHSDKKVIMYCTGGIRCEKATAYFRQKGFENLFQLDGGIIEYARQVEKKGLENRFRGKNFVFDERLGERISEEIIAQCHQCGEANDQHTNCANDACHLLFIQCPSCQEKYAGCCSTKCAEFVKLPIEEQTEKRKITQFNGSKFVKGRYKAHHRAHNLDLE